MRAEYNPSAFFYKGSITPMESFDFDKIAKISHLEFDEHEIIANEELLKQVFINLLDNAIKFSPENETVSVEIVDSKDVISVSIKNGGKEIPKENQAKIFNKFYQADESHATKGNGIGLAIVKKIVELHKGHVSVKSKDGETVFTVMLPKK